MKFVQLPLLGACLLASFLVPTQAVNAQETWEQRKSKVFKTLTDEQKESIKSALPEKATAKPKEPRKILVFYRCETFIHSSIPWGNFALQEMGKNTGAFEVDLADTYDVFTKENLERRC